MDRQASDLGRVLFNEHEEPKALPFSLLEGITNYFSDDHEIGRGGFAVVYKGNVGRRIVAVKRLSNAYMHEKEFHQEAGCLMKVKHKNVVRFLGYCADTQGNMQRHNGKFVMADVQQRLLCFEYLRRGSLHGYITDASYGLDWRKRYQIIKGICEGLHCLHQNYIVHSDLKPTNILLDDDMVPKIADFGLSRCFDENQSGAITKNIVGTLGYMPPEFYSGEITYKLDIYSLGVIIIEILTGQKGCPDVENVLESWRNRLRKSQQDIQLEQVRVCTEVGKECIDRDQKNRPVTQHIINRLVETESACTVTGVSSPTVPQASFFVEHDMLPDHVHHKNKSGEKNVTMGAYEKLCEVQECLSYCPSVDAVKSVPPRVQEIPGPFMSAENPNLQEVLKFIKDDPVGIIGIWGPGGVGKTHLLNNINNSLDGDVTFNYVVYVTTSKGCSVKKIQTQILDRLQLKSAPTRESQRWAIYDFLKNKNFLVLLDDLWDKIDLQAVGIPYPGGTVNHLKRKVVLTTRSRNVCGQMEVRKELKITYLQEDEAWLLFQEKVGHETLSSTPRIEALARELVKELKGLALALVTIGRAMYQKADPAQWEFAIQHMQQSCCDEDDHLDMEKAVFSRLKFSYDSLRTLRHCFLTCALWPEDWAIYKVDLAQCWIGLGLVDEWDIQSSYTKAYSLMGDLAAACLLEGSGSRDEIVGLHDVIRDMALWISCGCGEKKGKWFVRAGVGSNKKFSIPWSTAECISLMMNGLRKLPPVGFVPYPMKLKTLCLQNNHLDESTVADAIKNFTSLTYLDLSMNDLRRIPEELCYLPNLEYLDLSNNPDLHQVPHSFRKLVKLKFLYLQYTGIRSITEEVISSLQALQVIYLRTLVFPARGPVYYLPRVFRELGTLSHLKAVGIEVQGFAQYELLRNAANLPIRYLSVKAPDESFCFSDILPNDFAQRTLYELDITESFVLEQIIVRHELGQPNYQFGALHNLLLSNLLELREITWMGTSPAYVFSRLTYLQVHGCRSLEHLSWVMYLPFLEQLVVHSCFSMPQAFMRSHGDNMCSGQESSKTFPCLKFLDLVCNHSLDTIGDPNVTFPSLERLVLTGCPKLKNLPFHMHSLPLKLQVLKIDDIESWERLELEEGVKSFLYSTLKFGEYYYRNYHEPCVIGTCRTNAGYCLSRN